TDGAAGNGLDGGARAKQENADVECQLGDADYGVERGDGLVITILEEVTGRDCAHAPELRRDEPVEGRGKEPQPLVPDAGEAVGVRFGRYTDSIVAAGAGAEGEEGHEQLAEASAANEKVRGVLDLS